MANVLVIGASRGIGLKTVEFALAKGHNVRAFARSADRINMRHDNLEHFRGNALNAEDVQPALHEIDAVVQSLGVPLGPDLIIRPVTLFSKATQVLISLMEKSSARRLISVTGFGAGDSRKQIGPLQKVPFRLIFGRAYDDKSIQEDLIRQSKLAWTIARPVVLTNGSPTGRYQVLTEPIDWRNGFISRADVADFLTQQIDHDGYVEKTPVLSY